MSASERNACPDCGNPVPVDSPLGMCPTCLIGSLSLDDDLSNDEAESPFEKVAGYEIQRVLGEGGFAIVYEANQRKPIQRSVALKILRADIVSPQILARFEAEQQALAMMDHPNIAAVYDAGETESGVPFVAIELVDGVPITEYISQKSLSRIQKLEILKNICDAVQHAHLKGVIHRDLKPSNVIVTEVDGLPAPKVIDFGIARAIDVSLTDRTLFTEMHQLIGTPDYMSPEQASLENPSIDGRSDIYSLGVLIYETISGVHPFYSSDSLTPSVLEILRLVREVDPPRLSSHDSSLKGDIEWVVQKAMEKDPDHRYDSAGALAREIARIIKNHPVEAGPPSKRYLISKFIQRHRTLVAACSIAAISLVTGAIFSTVQYFRAATLATEVQANEIELRHTFRNADYQMALQLSERRRTAESIAYFCRALRTDPAHSASASCLLTLLSHHQFSKENDPAIAYPESVSKCRLPLALGANAENFAIGTTSKEQADAFIHFHFATGEVEVHPLSFDDKIKFLSITSPDGKFVLSDGNRLEIRDSSQPTDIQSQIDFSTPITQIATSPKQGLIIVGDQAGQLQVIQASTGNIEGEFDTGSAAITALSIGRDGSLVGYGNAEGKIGVWGLKLGFQNDSSTAHTSEVTSVAMATSGVLLASGDRLGNVHLHRLPQLRHIAGPLYHSNEISALNIASSSRKLVTGSKDGYARIWDLRTQRLSVPARYYQQSIAFIGSSYQPGNIITAGSDGTARVIDIETGNGEALSRAGRSSFLAVSQNRNELFSVSDSLKKARLLDLSRLNAQPQWLNQDDPDQNDNDSSITSIADFQAKLISEKQLKIFKNGQLLGAIRPTREIEDFALRDDGHVIAILHFNHLQLWNPATQEAVSPLISLTHRSNSIRFPDNNGQIDLRSDEFGWMRISIPPTIDSDIPEWFLDFSERIGGRFLDENGILHNTEARDLRQASKLLPANFDQFESVPSKYARWLIADPQKRELGPELEIQTADYIEKLIATQKRPLILEALRISPNHPTALRFLRTH